MKLHYDFSNLELFQDLLVPELDKATYDLHNSFDCTTISYKNTELSITFKSIEQGVQINVKLTDCSIEKGGSTFDSYNHPLNIDLFYRGRFEVDGELSDVSPNKRMYIYLNFIESISLECLCKTISFELESNVPTPS